jgi:hypothetical protein
MVALAAEEEERANLDLPKKLFHCAACRAPLKPPVFKVLTPPTFELAPKIIVKK